MDDRSSTRSRERLSPGGLGRRAAILLGAAALPASAGANGMARAGNGGAVNGFRLADYADYIAAFNRGDLDHAASYMAPNLLFEGKGRHLEGRDAFLTFYRSMKGRIREHVTPLRICVGDDGLAVEMATELHVLDDWPDFAVEPLKRGDVLRADTFIFYAIANGKFTHIRSATFKSQVEHPA